MGNTKFALALLLFGAGIAFGHFFLPAKTAQKPATARIWGPIREANNSYPLISPLLACEFSANVASKRYQPLGDELRNLVLKSEGNGPITNASVYFRDFQSGRWTGVNEADAYSPASLFKIPIMIAYFKMAEQNPAVLNEQLQYDHAFSQDIPQVIQSMPSIQIGQLYSVNQLISNMIKNSDNPSAELLLSHLDPSYIQEVFTDLGMNPSVFSENSDTMSAKSFALFFRILYNATYLNREMSEKALELLTQSNFPQGLAGGIPANVKIAHKFGERTFVQPSNGELLVRELNECGIVYAKTPYLLCVMARGSDYAKLSSVIQQISKATYDFVASHPTP